MKISIRRGIFETNSSSVHALSIRKNQDNLSIKEIYQQLSNSIKEDIENNGLIFGYYNYDNDIQEIKCFRYKCNKLWEAAFSDYFSKRNLLLLLQNIKDLAFECNVRYKVNYDMDNIYDDYSIISNIDTIEKLALYLFFDDSVFDIEDNNDFDQSKYDTENYDVYFDEV